MEFRILNLCFARFQMVLYLLLDVVIAYVLDLLFGDPYWLPHPVRFIGWLIKVTEKALRKAACQGDGS